MHPDYEAEGSPREPKLRQISNQGGSWRTGTFAAANCFCQCWSDLPESDAMWRLYSPDSMGVKLRARSRNLLHSLHLSTSSEKVFLGAVDYLPQEDLEALIRDAKRNHLIQLRPNLFETIPGEAWARCLLRKRRQFAHESEYRLVLAQTHPDSQPNAEPLFHYAVSLTDVVDEVELDPRCGDPLAVEQEQQLRTAGYFGTVKQSKFYETPNLVVRPSWPEHNNWSVGNQLKWTENRNDGEA